MNITVSSWSHGMVRQLYFSLMDATLEECLTVTDHVLHVTSSQKMI